ncbi:MAG: peroxiredoxin [Tatlockia sp.]|nr:peroxiredoxin [Tatlockia sp.]
MKLGDQLPSLQFNATNGVKANFDAYRGKWLVLYFYPKDATPGCTQQGQDFRDAYSEIKHLNAEIFGISRDSLKLHENFKVKQQFPFELIADHEEELCQLFEVIKMKSMYGKQVRGIERSTFIFNPQGILKYQWRKLNVKGHVAELIKTLQNLQAE